MSGKSFSRSLIAALPADIRRVIYFRQLRDTGFFAAWYAALAYGIFRYTGAAGLRSVRIEGLIALVFVLGVIPFFIFGFGRAFCESTYSGVITEVKTVGSWSGFSRVQRSVKVGGAAYARITVRTESGAKKTLVLENSDSRHNFYYTPGAPVAHYRYIQLPRLLCRNPESDVVCVICGEYCGGGEDKCPKCGHTLLG